MPEQSIRPPTGAALDPDTLDDLRRALRGHRGAREIAEALQVSDTALARAAAGCRVHRGTRTLIAIGLDRLRAAGELPRAVGAGE